MDIGDMKIYIPKMTSSLADWLSIFGYKKEDKKVNDCEKKEFDIYLEKNNFSFEQCMLLIEAYASNPKEPCYGLANALMKMFEYFDQAYSHTIKKLVNDVLFLLHERADHARKIRGINGKIDKEVQQRISNIRDKLKELEMAKLTAKVRNKLPKSEFGEPGKRAYPMPDKSHARNAKARASEMEHKGKISPTIKAKIDAKANRVLGKGKKKTLKSKPA